MADIIPLEIHPFPIDPDVLELVKRAKAELALDYKVLPVKAVPGGTGRVLAFGELPPFVCDAGLVRDTTNYGSVLAALRWVLTADANDSRGFRVLDYLNALLGPGVREVTDESEGGAAW